MESVEDMLPDMIIWSDNMNLGAWYYYDVQEATNTHDFERKEDEVNEVWTAILPNRDWTAYAK